MYERKERERERDVCATKVAAKRSTSGRGLLVCNCARYSARREKPVEKKIIPAARRKGMAKLEIRKAAIRSRKFRPDFVLAQQVSASSNRWFPRIKVFDKKVGWKKLQYHTYTRIYILCEIYCLIENIGGVVKRTRKRSSGESGAKMLHLLLRRCCNRWSGINRLSRVNRIVNFFSRSKKRMVLASFETIGR